MEKTFIELILNFKEFQNRISIKMCLLMFLCGRYFCDFKLYCSFDINTNLLSQLVRFLCSKGQKKFRKIKENNFLQESRNSERYQKFNEDLKLRSLAESTSEKIKFE